MIDGEIGSIDRFFFDDERWTVRHIVVDLGTWLAGRRVLISPAAVLEIDDERNTVRVNLTKEKVRASPDIDTEKPVSRQQEITLHRHYGYAPYWGGGGLWAGGYFPAGLAIPPPASAPFELGILPDLEGSDESNGDSHLRSTKEVAGYHLRTTDGEVGHVDDFLIDDESWAIRSLVVDTSNWPGGRSVLVPVDWVKEVDWSRLQISIDASSQQVREREEYNQERFTSPPR
jgi:sporulation protein YlmC with PRC-barrel domain